MEETRKLLIDCAQYYHNLKLPEDCQEDKFSVSAGCLVVPPHCTKDNAVYNILHYLVDVDFLPPNVSIEKDRNESIMNRELSNQNILP